MKTKEIYKNLNMTYSFYSRFVKRFFDFFLSLLAIVVLSPVLLITWLLTLMFLGGPAIYKQVRPGKKHKTFYIYKFRSMTNKKDENGNLLPDEQRITKFGKFLRKTSLDELPQLFNILKGDMSIIGPRPRLVKDMVFYDKEVYDYYYVKPGLTGPTQAFGRNKNTWEQVFEKDVEYAKRVTFGYDFKIFIYTFISVFKNKGETHSNAEEDKNQVEKEQEYYYPDYLLRIGKITKEQYDKGLEIANDIVKNLKVIEYYPELHKTEEKTPTYENKDLENVVLEHINENDEKNLENGESLISNNQNENSQNNNLQENSSENLTTEETNNTDETTESV